MTVNLSTYDRKSVHLSTRKVLKSRSKNDRKILLKAAKRKKRKNWSGNLRFSDVDREPAQGGQAVAEGRTAKRKGGPLGGRKPPRPAKRRACTGAPPQPPKINAS
jgi:hypothetical protein